MAIAEFKLSIAVLMRFLLVLGEWLKACPFETKAQDNGRVQSKSRLGTIPGDELLIANL